MKGKKILFITVLVAFLILMTTCVSAVNVSVTKKQEAVKIEKKVDNKKEQLTSNEINEIKEEVNNFENLNIDWNDLLFRFLVFIYWAVYTGLLILSIPSLLTILPLVGVIMGIVGVVLGLIEKTGDLIPRFVAGFILSYISLLAVEAGSFHLWTNGRFLPEEGDPSIIELFVNLMAMFYGEDFDLKTLL